MTIYLLLCYTRRHICVYVLQALKLRQTATAIQRYKLTRTRPSCCLATWRVYRLLTIDYGLCVFFRFPEMINRPFSRTTFVSLSLSLSLVSSSIRARAHRCRITAIYEIARHFTGPNHNLNPRDNKRGMSFETSLFLPTRACKIRIKWHVEEGVFPRSCWELLPFKSPGAL